MDQSFNDRVDKVFGSISSSSSTPWSLTDAQVERRVWNRHKADNKDDDDDETLVSSSFDNLFNGRSNRRKSLDEDDDEDVGGDDAFETENDVDEWDIRSSIGLDSTLDKEVHLHFIIYDFFYSLSREHIFLPMISRCLVIQN